MFQGVADDHFVPVLEELNAQFDVARVRKGDKSEESTRRLAVTDTFDSSFNVTALRILPWAGPPVATGMPGMTANVYQNAGCGWQKYNNSTNSWNHVKTQQQAQPQAPSYEQQHANSQANLQQHQQGLSHPRSLGVVRAEPQL